MPPALKIENLENWLALKPNDPQAIRQLVTLLEFEPSAPGSAGAFSAAQTDIIKTLGNTWKRDVLEMSHMTALYAGWLDLLRAHGVSQAVPIGQAFSGRVLKVKGQNVHCGAWLKFFKETEVIPALCNDCYKVQILPHDVRAMFQTYFLLLNLDLPNDNARKCMIELRDGIKYPYKAYIYSDSIEDVQACLRAFRDLQASHGVVGVSSKISHGCSEYGQRYPSFKYPDSGQVPAFGFKPEWRAIEQGYFKSVKLPASARASNTRPHVSLRDVFAFCTWVRYARLIGDESSAAYTSVPGPNLPPAFVKRVRSQAAKRKQEMQELQAKAQ